MVSMSLNRYRWKFNDKDFNPDALGDRIMQFPNVGTIIINNPEKTDEGIYQCFADNGYGVSVSQKAYLKYAVVEPFPMQGPRVGKLTLYKTGNSFNIHIQTVQIHFRRRRSIAAPDQGHLCFNTVFSLHSVT